MPECNLSCLEAQLDFRITQKLGDLRPSIASQAIQRTSRRRFCRTVHIGPDHDAHRKDAS